MICNRVDLVQVGFTYLIMRFQVNNTQLERLEQAMLEQLVESLAGSDPN
ncbi:MAG: hypothetical protein VXZ82_02405 [Planctomycetota bacterium]|nr:hypothetical protein [Planctomycetota bacterium]